VSTSGVSSGVSGLLSEQLINESGGLTSGSTLTNGGAGGTLQLTGLASGINTTELIQAELAQEEQPLSNMEDEVTALGAENSSLGTIQTQLQTVTGDALLLGEPSTFFPVQNITSSDPSLVSAATTSGPGATIGSTSITVTALAGASQTAFAYTAGTSSGENTLSITTGTNGKPVTESIQVADNATADDIAGAVNDAGNLGVWATVNTSGQLVLSSQATGSGNEVSAALTDATGSSATLAQSGTARDGTDAVVNILNSDGTVTTVDSPTDAATNVIPGVTLTLAGITGTTATANPVTITSDAPGPNTTAITQLVQQLVSDYNTALNTIEGDTDTTPASESTPADYSPYSGSLFGDDQLENLASDLRTSLYQDYSGTGISPTMSSLQDIGISAGAPNASPLQSTVQGDLTVNTTQLASALASNPSGVQALVSKWSQGFQSVLNAAAGPAGAIEARITGNDTLVTSMNGQVKSQEALYNQEEKQMEEQWAQVESTLENLKNQNTSLATFATGLGSSSSSSSSGG
jgi:flagellar hook-associated protein 2